MSSIRTTGAAMAPTLSPYRVQMACGMICVKSRGGRQSALLGSQHINDEAAENEKQKKRRNLIEAQTQKHQSNQRYLPEREDERDGDEYGDDGRHERVEEYRQRLHGERVADEERAEQEVLVLDDRQDPGCARARPHITISEERAD
jgi:hypothetical protein